MLALKLAGKHKHAIKSNLYLLNSKHLLAAGASFLFHLCYSINGGSIIKAGGDTRSLPPCKQGVLKNMTCLRKETEAALNGTCSFYKRND